MVEKLLLHGVPVETGDGGQPPGNGGAGPAPGFEVAGEGLDVRAADLEQRQRASAAPAGELAQVERVCLACQAAVPGQVAGEGEPLGLAEHRLKGDEAG